MIHDMIHDMIHGMLHSMSQETWHFIRFDIIYRQTSNISRTLDGNKLVDHSVIAGAAPTTSSFRINTGLTWVGQRYLQDEKRSRKTFEFWDLVRILLEVWYHIWHDICGWHPPLHSLCVSVTASRDRALFVFFELMCELWNKNGNHLK